LKPNHSIILVFLLIILSACGSPSWVIPESKIENMLLDIHLADAEVERNYQTFGRNEIKKQELYNAVFEKYGVTPEQFDTSLAWYSANLKEYVKMYERITTRLKTLSDTLTVQIRLAEERLLYESTVNIWEKPSYIMLENPSLMFRNILTFKIDTIQFEKGDTYELKFETLGVNENTPVITGLYATLADTTLSQYRTITENENTNLTLTLSSDQKTETLSGFIYISSDSSLRSCVMICNIILNQRKSTLRGVSLIPVD
jgi:hypothetical protein